MAGNGTERSFNLFERFPALLQLGRRSSQRPIPYIPQLPQSECGMASLAMVLNYYGKAARIEELRQIHVTDRSGMTAQDFLPLGGYYGLRGGGVALEVEEMELLDRGAILHWNFDHFVVFEKLDGKTVHIVDPAGGRRRVPLEQVRRSFTGVALLLEPSDEFEPTAGERRAIWDQLRQVLSQSGDWYR